MPCIFFFFSLLASQEWGAGLTHKYRGGYRLESDQSWTPLERLSEVDEKMQWTNRLMAGNSEEMRMLTGRREFDLDENKRKHEQMDCVSE